MATQTTGNLKLSKPDGTDKVKEFRAPYNSNLDKIDEAVSAQSQQIATLDGRVDNSIIAGTNHVLSTGGTIPATSVSCPGMTPNHKVGNWGLSTGSIQNPPAEIEIVEGTNEYTLTVSNVTADFNFTPIFILPQN